MNKLLILVIAAFTFAMPVVAQRVSIGNTMPAAKLDITGPGAIPAIPGTVSNGILRIGVNPIEAIDIGKMVDSTFAGWIQAGYNGFVPDPLSLQPAGGNVGIGTINPVNKLSVTGNTNITGKLGVGNINPSAKLDIIGTIKIADGTQGEGKVLTSNDIGLASWQPPPPPPPAYYASVGICCQSWMTKNLDVSTYRNGDPIPQVTDNAEWIALTTGAYCYYNNDSTTYAATYGKLYNWYAVNDSRGLAPEGWHIPSYFEWNTLAECLGGASVAGALLKEEGNDHWDSPNYASNVSGFTALPGGQRTNYGGGFITIGSNGIFWSQRSYDSNNAWMRDLSHQYEYLGIESARKVRGFSVRCIKD